MATTTAVVPISPRQRGDSIESGRSIDTVPPISVLINAKLTRRATVACDCAPSLEDVLFERRGRPYVVAVFREFLLRRHAHETLDFLVAVKNLAAMTDNERLRAESIKVVAEFVAQGSQYEINVSYEQRNETLAAFAALDPNASRVTVISSFKRCYDEMYRLLERDLFKQWLSVVDVTNITETQARIRYSLSFFFLVTGAVAPVVVAVVARQPHVSLLSFIGWYSFAIYFLNARNRVCDGLVNVKTFMVDAADSCLMACFRPRAEQVWEDEYAYNRISSVSRRQQRQASVFAFVAGIVTWALVFALVPDTAAAP